MAATAAKTTPRHATSTPARDAIAEMMRDRRRQPAEWEMHEACWVAWPSHAELWGEALEPVRRAFVQMCLAIGGVGRGEAERPERLQICVLDEQGEKEARRSLSALEHIRFVRLPFGDIWLRDTAPLFLRGESGAISAACLRFNGWGGKYRLPGDAELSARISDEAGVRAFAVDMVGEGGAIEVDGEGTCITTRQCLLNPNRNPGLSEADIEALLREALGIEKVVWLDEGLAGDHTDGHVDNLARFVGPGRVACMRPTAGDPNRRVLEEIRSRLAASRDVAGRRLELVEIESPGGLVDADGALMPAGYMNFYISNTAVIVPLFGRNTDDAALETIGNCFPERRVVGIDARALLGGGGAIHCITQQQPVSPNAAGEGEAL